VPLGGLLMPLGSHPSEEGRGSSSEHPSGAAPIGPAAGPAVDGGAEEEDTDGRFQDDFTNRCDWIIILGVAQLNWHI
jgi:hypothetical protein